MTKIISQKDLSNDVEELKEKVNRNLCPTEFSGPDLIRFMSCFQDGDILESVPLYDNVHKRETVALRVRRMGEVLMILQRGKPIGD